MIGLFCTAAIGHKYFIQLYNITGDHKKRKFNLFAILTSFFVIILAILLTRSRLGIFLCLALTKATLATFTRLKNKLLFLVIITIGLLVTGYCNWPKIKSLAFQKNTHWYKTDYPSDLTNSEIKLELDLSQQLFKAGYKLFIITDSRNPRFKTVYLDASISNNGDLILTIDNSNLRQREQLKV